MNNIDLISVLSQAANIAMTPYTTMGAPLSPSSQSTESGKSATVHKAGKSPVKKRTWKKHKDAPKRPLSAYNLFFQAEREKIVKDAYPSMPLDPAQRRKHRKTHGKIGFAALARNISSKWKSLGDEEKSPFEAKARIEKKRYQKEMDAWRAKRQGQRVCDQEEEQQPKAEKTQTIAPQPDVPMSDPRSRVLSKKQGGSKMSTNDLLSILSKAQETCGPLSGDLPCTMQKPMSNCNFPPLKMKPLHFRSSNMQGPSVPCNPLNKPEYQRSGANDDSFHGNIDKILGTFDSNLDRILGTGPPSLKRTTSLTLKPFKVMSSSSPILKSRPAPTQQMSLISALSSVPSSSLDSKQTFGDLPQFDLESDDMLANLDDTEIDLLGGDMDFLNAFE